MLFYTLNILTIYFWRLYSLLSRNKFRDLAFLCIVAIQLFFIAALRDNSVGTDTLVYVTRYQVVANTSWGNIFDLEQYLDFEPGFLIYMKFISMFSTNPRIYLVITSLIITASVATYIYKYSENYFLSVIAFIAMGFWGDSMNIQRQFLAIAILLWSISFIKQRKLIKFVIYVAIATMFHYSSIVFLISYPLMYFKPTKIYVFCISVISFVMYIFSEKIVNFSINLFGYNEYTSVIGKSSGSGMLVLLLLVLVAGFVYRRQSEKYIEDFNLFYNFIIVAFILNILSLKFALFGRVMVFFTIHIIILVTKIIESIPYKIDKKVGYSIVVIGMFYYYFFRVLIFDGPGVVPFIF